MVRGDQVGGHEHLVGIGLAADADVHEQHQEDALLAVAEDFLHRCFRFDVSLLEFLEDGAFLQSAADDHGHDGDDDAGQEQHAPAPCHEGIVGQQLGQDPDDGAEGGAQGGARHDEGGEFAAFTDGRGFGEKCCAT